MPSTPTLTARHVGELVAELAPLLEGLELRSAQALPPRDLLLVFETADERVLRLRVSTDPDAPRLHLQHGSVKSYDGPPGPFYRRAAEDLEGLRLKTLEQVRGDRIARLLFDGDRRRALVVELAGRHGNLVLLDGSGNVLGVLVEPPAKKRKDGRPPRLVAGEPWSAPPGKPPAEPGPALAEAFPDPGEEVRRFADAPAPCSRRVEAALGGSVVERDLSRERKSLRERLERRRKAAVHRRRGLDKRRAAADDAERVRMDGELLKSVLGTLRRGAREVEVPDWFTDGAPRTLALDPQRTPQANLERFFTRYQKLLRSREGIEREVELAEAEVATLEGLLARVDGADPAELEGEAIDAGVLKKRATVTRRDAPPTARRLPYRTFRGHSGAEIRVGRSAKDNDQLCSRHARGNDLWLHTRDSPGSHVILRLERGAEPEQEDLLDAAHLAAHFSPLKDSPKVAVHVARRKEVHKPRGAPAGLVTLSGGRTLDLRIEPGRLQRLLGRREP